MDARDLKVFVTIFDSESVSRTADILDIRQSNVSMILNRLRVQFSDKLFIRTGKGMEPTARARELAPKFRLAIEALDRLSLDGPEFDPATITTQFRVVGGDILEATIVMALIGELSQKAPKSGLKCFSIASREIEALMANGEIDVCVGNYPGMGRNVMETTISKFTFGCFSNKHHRFAEKNISLQEFENEPCIVIDEDCSINNIVEKWMLGNHIIRRIAVRASHFSTVRAALAGSMVIAIVPTDMSKSWLFEGNVAQVFLPFELPVAELKLYWHSAYHDDPRNSWFRRTLLRKLKRMSYGGPDYGLMSKTQPDTA